MVITLTISCCSIIIIIICEFGETLASPVHD